MTALEAAEEILPDTHTRRVQYTARIHTTGGRDGGASRSSEGRLDISFSLPGSVRPGTNPEQLLAAGWSSCFLSAMKLEAQKLNIGLPFAVAVDAEVDLCLSDEAYSLQARFDISLPGMERDIAQAIVDLARRTCPYSKATRGNIEVAINLI
jgi:Ohr subfamily peroxiredoxin